MLIAIDGPAASGKGTVARRVADEFGLVHMDTGRLYRLVGWELLNRAKVDNREPVQMAIEIAQSINLANLNSPELETEDVGRAASIVSAIPEVRGALLELQRRTAKSPIGAVLDGRDIGTVVCPQADFKFYITADAEIRARRRFEQLKRTKKDITEAQILQDIIERDKRDSERKVAPLVPALDAIFIDTSRLDINEVFEKVAATIRERRKVC